MLYQHALSDLDTRGLSSKLVTVEIGHWQPNTNFSLQLQVPSLPLILLT